MKKNNKKFEQTTLIWHLFAYLLHPKCKDVHLRYKQKEGAKELLQKKTNPSLLLYAVILELKEKPFQNKLFSKQLIMTINANKWWENVSKSHKISKEFCKLIPVVLQSRECFLASLLSTQKFEID